MEGGEIARSTHDKLKNEMPGSFPQETKSITMKELRETNNPMDLACVAKVFRCLTKARDSVYTWDGQFYVNADGEMVNSMGHQFADNEAIFRRFRKVILPSTRKARFFKTLSSRSSRGVHL